jgi:hypothetical protein
VPRERVGIVEQRDDDPFERLERAVRHDRLDSE